MRVFVPLSILVLHSHIVIANQMLYKFAFNDAHNDRFFRCIDSVPRSGN